VQCFNTLMSREVHQTPRYAMQKSLGAERNALQHKDTPHLAVLPQLLRLTGHWISHEAFGRPDLFIEQPQSLASVDAPVGQHHRIVLHDALCVMCIRHIAGEFVKLGAANGTDCCRG
jgi:hypothetical protein